MRICRLLLTVGTVIPLVYIILMVGAQALYPGYDAYSQVPSEFGMADAPYDWAFLFNTLLVAVAVFAGFAAVALFLGLRSLGVGSVVNILLLFTTLPPALNLALSGLFPLPHPWHSFPYFLLLGNFVPLTAILAVKGLPETRAIVVAQSVFLLYNVVLTLFILEIIPGVTDHNLGMWARLWAVALMVPTAALCWFSRSRCYS